MKIIFFNTFLFFSLCLYAIDDSMPLNPFSKIITIKSSFCSPYINGYVAFQSQDSELNIFNLYDMHGKPLFYSQFNLISSFNNGAALAMGSNYAYVLYQNGDSKILEQAIVGDLENFGFFENLAPIFSYDSRTTGYINIYGRYVIPAMYKSGKSFSNGLAPVLESQKDGLWGYINHCNKLKIPFQYKEANSFSSDDRVATVMKSHKEGWFFIDLNGNPLDLGFYRSVGTFSNGLCPVNKHVNDSDYYIDLRGNEHFKGKFKILNSFSEGLAAVSIDGEKYGYINRNGEMVIPPQYCYVMPFKDGHAIVCTQTPEVGDQIINARGEVVLDIKTFQKQIEKHRKEFEEDLRKNGGKKCNN